MRIADTRMERILVEEHVQALREAAGPLSLRLRLGRWLVLTGLRVAPELRSVTSRG
jgi:hypothetical protein